MKPRESRSPLDVTRHKISVLRAYLMALQESRTVDLYQVDALLNRGDVHVSSGRIGALERYLAPEVLMQTNREGTKPVFLVLTVTVEVLEPTLEVLDTWLHVQRHANAQQDISKALRVLQSAGSRLSSKSHKSEASKAVNVLRRLLSEEGRSAA